MAGPGDAARPVEPATGLTSGSRNHPASGGLFQRNQQLTYSASNLRETLYGANNLNQTSIAA